MIKKAKFTAVEAGTAVTEKRKTSLRMSRKALSAAYADIKKVVGEMPMSLTAFLEQAREEASSAVAKDKKKKPPKPIVIIRWKVIIITGYFYLDGALVMTVSATVVREEVPV